MGSLLHRAVRLRAGWLVLSFGGIVAGCSTNDPQIGVVEAPLPAVELPGNPPTAPADTPAPEPAPEPTPAEAACDFSHDRAVAVAGTGALSSALAAATPGTLIRLEPGTYAGPFRATAAGTAERPIVLCGPRTAVLDGGTTGTGYVVHLDGADHWVLSGFTVTRGKKGVMLDRADHNELTGLLVHTIGEEAIHLRRGSSDNVVAYSEVRDTGLVTPGFGEGVYVGSAQSQWETMTGSSETPDRADRNRVLNNAFGPGITAEHVDIKEGTTGGEVRGNTFNGLGISGANYADSWVDVKGNGWVLADNTGFDTPLDGFQLHVARSGWGNDNVFANNVANVNGPGYGFMLDGDATGNALRCDNAVYGAARGFANVSCGDAAAPPPSAPPPPPSPPSSGLSADRPPSGNFDLSHWYLTLPSGSTVSVAELNSGYQYANVFYTDPATGGMVFRCPNIAGTTTNSSYSRTELREMLNPSNTSAKDDSNNWTTADGGTLRATLRVDHVSTTGDDGKVGRVVIGQIHGVDSEPIRLYFHKRPGDARGRIYAAHDTASNVNSYSPDIVGNAGGAGIALGETFGYEIKLVDITLTVRITTASETFNYTKIIDSAYRGENLYFKAGVYNQNNTGDSADYVQATFFALTHTHP